VRRRPGQTTAEVRTGPRRGVPSSSRPAPWGRTTR
jgi:hypothetical protein